MHHNLKERKKRTEKKERRITHYKIANNLNGLEKYSLIFGEQPQRLRKINICNNLITIINLIAIALCVHCTIAHTCTCIQMHTHSRSCREVFQESKLPSTPYFVNVDYSTGRAINYWMDALSASFAGVQVWEGQREK